MTNLKNLQDWIISDEGLKGQIGALSRALATQEFSNLTEATEMPWLDWARLIFSASLLAKSSEQSHLEIALRVAHAGLLLKPSTEITDACLLLLNDLSNYRAIALAEEKDLAPQDFFKRIGFSARLDYVRKKIDNSIFQSYTEPLVANTFQQEFWTASRQFQWIYASAPTAAGKTFIVFQFILEQLRTKKARLIIYVAPTRALVSEVEKELLKHCAAHELTQAVKVYSIPLAKLYDSNEQAIFVFTQERLHLFLNATKAKLPVDILIVDEAHKIGEGMRGVILQEAIERVVNSSPKTKVLFLSPPVKNPNELLLDMPDGLNAIAVNKRQPMVNQNLVYAVQSITSSLDWTISLASEEELITLGNVKLPFQPTTLIKRIALVAAQLTQGQKGVLIYANGPADAEDIGILLKQLMPEQSTSNFLSELVKLSREGVHKEFRLADVVPHGIAFHYGNMPSLLREKIEEGFNKGEIRYLICTATLIEGVNLSCRTIFIRAPQKGNGKPMIGQDFWNLAGRAGRWGKEFQGNIVCVDPGQWKTGVPKKAEFEVERQTEKVLRNPNPLLEYIKKRTFDIKTMSTTQESLEEVLAYLLTVYIRNGSLSTISWADRLPVELIQDLEKLLLSKTDKIEIPIAIIEKHSGVSAVAMQTLLEYFRKKGPAKNKPATDAQNLKLLKWIPLTPDNTHAFENMRDLLRRITLKLYPAFGPNGRESYCAVLILNWMRGYPLPRIIQGNIEYFKDKEKPPSIDAIIRNTMKDVEEIARFKAPKYIACYIDILKFYLVEIGRVEMFKEDHPFELYLEFGVMSETFISLMLLGLSRMTAVELGNKIINSELDEKGCLAWMLENDLTKLNLPNFALLEIGEKLGSKLGGNYLISNI